MEYQIPNRQFVSTLDYHKNRQSAHHVDQTIHALRLFLAASMAEYLRKFCNVHSVVDLGCGDGGLIEYLVYRLHFEDVCGYDFTPANVDYALDERDVEVKNENFLENIETITKVDLTIMTEVLEHIEDPHGVVSRISSPFLIVSSPNDETFDRYDQSHRWVWDSEGYVEMIMKSGFRPIDVVDTSTTTLVMARR